MVRITIIFVLTRATVRFVWKKSMKILDYLLYVACIIYAATCVLYLCVTQQPCRLNDVTADKFKIWSTMQRDMDLGDDNMLRILWERIQWVEWDPPRCQVAESGKSSSRT